MVLSRFKLLGVFTAITIWTLSFSSCIPDSNKSNKPRSIGNSSEVLVVLQNQEQWDGQIGQVIRKYLGQEQYGLPQSEPIFKLSHITVANFSDLFKKHRNLLIVEIDPTITNSKMEVFSDFWAGPQRVFRIKCPSADAFVETFATNEQTIISTFGEAERARILDVFRPTSKNKVSEAVQKQFKLNMVIPAGFYMAKSETGFMWIRKEIPEYSQGIIIMSEPYMSEAQFSLESIVARINRNLEQYVPGSSEGSFMVIDQKFVLPEASQVDDFPAEYTIEIRGMWNVANDFMGGPFVSYSFTDKENKDIFTLMGYVYYPNNNKRDLLRQVEAILYSVTPVK
ncbi:MAG: DUF4837 family protein [Bacteroidales bacterium]|nr:DUF4837 family protein [Bacteroidales bacterium]